MRIFTAIPVPQAAREAFKRIAPGKLPIPYINTDNFYILLCHLGELEHDQAQRVIAEWDKGLPDFKDVKIEAEKVDKNNHQLVIYLKDNPELVRMKDALEAHFKSLGLILQPRDFRPHITLGKMHLDNVMFRARKTEDFPNDLLADMAFTAETIALYESKMLLHHPNYTILGEHKLT